MRSLKSTSTLDKLEKFLAGKKFPFNDQFECENFLLQLTITSKLKVSCSLLSELLLTQGFSDSSLTCKIHLHLSCIST